MTSRAYKYIVRKINGDVEVLHRRIMQRKIHRELTAKEQIVHIDNDPFNLRRDNLLLRADMPELTKDTYSNQTRAKNGRWSQGGETINEQ